MTLKETVIAVREYSDKCRDKNLENYTSNGIEIDPHTLAWAGYWLTKMSNLKWGKDGQIKGRRMTDSESMGMLFDDTPDVPYDAIKQKG